MSEKTTDEIVERLRAARHTMHYTLQARADEAITRLSTLSAELAKAREVIAKLPKTADGVPIVPGMEIYGPGAMFSTKQASLDVWWSQAQAALAAKGPTNE